jgi:hypothetical protein
MPVPYVFVQIGGEGVALCIGAAKAVFERLFRVFRIHLP